MSTVRVRFAPSPTGPLHVGGARTALFNYLYAKHHDGQFILRIEDTDRERNSEESLRGILDALQWLGLPWDEGPFFQSKRLDLYEKHINHLLETNRAYACFCTAEELEVMRNEQRARNEAPRYDGRCFTLSEEERRTKQEAGEPHVIRFRANNEGDMVVDDLIRGQVQFANAVVDDFVIVKSDGMPTYQLAVVVDDADMNITHVIRGEEHLSNTPKQVQLYEALGYTPPRFAHIPLILAEDRSKLSKRHGSVWVGQFREDGYLPEALVNYLALVGWAYDDKTELFSREELIQYFSFEGVSKHSAIFDYKKLAWMNGTYIRALSIEQFYEQAVPVLQAAQAIPETLSADDKERLMQILSLLQTRVGTLAELPSQVAYFFADEITFDPKAVERFFGRDYIIRLFEYLLAQFRAVNNFNEEELAPIFKRFGKENDLKMGDVMQPVRVAVTGTTMSPPMYDTLMLLGRQTTLQRLEEAIEYVNELQ